MNIDQHIASLFSQPCYCRKENYKSFGFRLIKSAENGNDPFPDKSQPKKPTHNASLNLITVDPYWEGMGISELEGEDAVAVSIVGVLTKYDTWWAGSKSIIKTLEAIEANESIQTVVLVVDGPGGYSHAIQDLGEYIRSMSTTTVAFVEDMAASAHQQLVASCNVCFANNKMAIMGSIGTYQTVFDDTGFWESMGIKVEDIYAPESDKKNESYRAWVDGDPSKIKAETSVWAKDFITKMKELKPGIDSNQKDIYKGITIHASEALEIGLIDGIGTIQDALDFAKGKTQNTNTDMNNPFKSIAEWAGLKKDEKLTPEQLSTVNQKLAESKAEAFLVPATDEIPDYETFSDKITEVEQISTDLSTEKANHSETKGKLETAENSISSLKSLFGEDAEKEDFNLNDAVKQAIKDQKDFKEKPAGGAPAGTEAKADENASGKKKGVEAVQDSSREHNKRADAMGLGPKALETA
jgi:ClpP class serine protease